MAPQHDSLVRDNVLMIAYTNYESDPRVIREAEAGVEGRFGVDFIALRRGAQPAEEMVRGVRVLRVRQERYRGASRVQYLLSYVEFFLRGMVMATRLHFSRRYKVVHVNNMPDALVWSMGFLKLMGVKVILDIHDPMPETFGSKFTGAKKSGFYQWLLLAERISVAFADRTITVSEPVRTGVLLEHGYRPDSIGVVANFADDELFQLLPYPPVKDKVRFAFHGTILERNGLGTVVEALTLVRHRDRMHVRIIGEGDFSATLASLIATHNLSAVVDFRNRSFPLHEIPAMLSDCHVGVVPLRLSTVANFALPLKLVEYTCVGMPSISIRNAAIEYYLRSDECLFFDAGDAAGLAALMDHVAEHPEKLLEYRKKLLIARERLLWSGEKKKYIALLRELAGTAAMPETRASTAEQTTK